MSVTVQSAITGLAGTCGPNGAVAVLAGPLHDVVRQVWPGEAILHYFGASDRRRQVWHACLAQNAFLRREYAEPLWRVLLGESDRRLLEEAFGVVVPGAARALGKLGPVAVNAAVYPAIFALLREGGLGAKYVRHAPNLTGTNALVAAVLPPALRAPALIKGCRGPADARQVAWYARRFEELTQTAVTGEIASALLVRPHAEAVCEALRTHRLLKQLLPTPPYPASGPMRPLLSLQEAAETGRQFRNCIGSSVYVREGNAVYVWQGPEPAVIELQRWPGFAWEITEIKGVANARVSGETWAAVVSIAAEDVRFW